MFNHKEFRDAFLAARQIYCTSEIHVNLLARQLGVLAIDIIEYIEANPTLITTRMNSISSGYSNPNSDGEYFGTFILNVSTLPYLTTQSFVREGDNGGTIVVTLSGNTFHAVSETEANWTVDVGTTGLTFTTAVKDSTTQVTLTFTGTAKRGTISIMAEALALATNRTVNSDILYSPIVELNYTIDSLTDIAVDILALEARVTALEPAE